MSAWSCHDKSQLIFLHLLYSKCVMTLFKDVLMCDSQSVQVIDKRALSMLVNEITCSSACFMGIQKTQEMEGATKETNYSETTQQEQSGTDRMRQGGQRENQRKSFVGNKERRTNRIKKRRVKL